MGEEIARVIKQFMEMEPFDVRFEKVPDREFAYTHYLITVPDWNIGLKGQIESILLAQPEERRNNGKRKRKH